MTEEIFNAQSVRAQVLWRFAYAFLRLDQLPSGGWGKTLASWMDLIWRGDYGSIPRNPQMRTSGGTDLTTYTFYCYKLFLDNVLSPAQVTLLLRHNSVADRVYDNFKEKVNFEGAVGGRRGLGVEPDVRVRHTLMGLITFLQFGKTHQDDASLQDQDILDRTYRYLVDKIPDWKHDKSHVLGMTASAIKLHEMLGQPVFCSQLTEGYQAQHLRDVLAQHIPDMIGVVSRTLEYNPVPAGTIQGPLVAKYFSPYYDFWRMERSNFLMNFPFLITDDGEKFLPQVPPNIQMRCADIFSQFLGDIQYPYNDSDPSVHLIHYHRLSGVSRGSNGCRGFRDWGISAELAILLRMKSVRDALVEHADVTEEELDEKNRVLTSALLRTFDYCHKEPEIFSFTHGSSYARILHLFNRGSIKSQALNKLDEAVTLLCDEGVTEQGILRLLTEHICVQETEQDQVEYRALKNFLVAKLESGEYTPDGHICKKASWEERLRNVVDHSTIDFYNSDLGKQHANRWENDPERNLISELQHRFDWQPGEEKTALDVGCAGGHYAALLMQMGFKVTLLEASIEMLNRAHARLGIAPNTFRPINIYDIDWGYQEQSFDLIFACAIMIHVPKERRTGVYSNFHRLLKSGGLLFVNYKIGDHTLISEDGRFFAYYRDESWPMTELEDHGFRVEAVVLNTKDRNMYHDRKLIRWANLYCRKME